MKLPKVESDRKVWMQGRKVWMQGLWFTVF